MKLPIEVLGVTVGYVEKDLVIAQSMEKVKELRAELLVCFLKENLVSANIRKRDSMFESRVVRLCNELSDSIDQHNILLANIDSYEIPF